MIIAYYTNREGKIVNHHGCPPDKTKGDMIAAAALYNAQSAERKDAPIAHVEEVPDNGITAYLFEKAHERIAANKEDLRVILDDIDRVREAIEGLAW